LNAPLICVVGPTASSKTELSIRLAERIGGEIINADSVQVYEHFDIGSGKPSPAELARASHHLMSFRDPHEPLDAGAWATLAARAIAEVCQRRRLPIICGGTFLWVRALVFGLAEAPRGSDELRQKYRALADAEGREAVHRRLGAVDPKSAERLNPNDLVRVSRALEVFEVAGVPLSTLHADHGFREPRYDFRFYGVEMERGEHDRRILERTRNMFDVGLVEEVRSLSRRGFDDARAMGAVGYKQVRAALTREPELTATRTLIDEVYRATRVFARRQRTWLREAPVTWLSGSGSLEDKASEIAASL
jgi:tRNA dimethylallyltransferase